MTGIEAFVLGGAIIIVLGIVGEAMKFYLIRKKRKAKAVVS